MELDRIDRRILAILQEDGRIANVELAERIGLSPTSIGERLKRLQREGVVAGYTVRMHPGANARMLQVHVLLNIDTKRTEAVVAALRAMPQVRAVYAISGSFDCLAFVEGETTGEIDRALDAIGAIPGVSRTQSSLVLSVKFDRR